MEATGGMSLLSVWTSCCVSVWSGSELELNLAALFPGLLWLVGRE